MQVSCCRGLLHSNVLILLLTVITPCIAAAAAEGISKGWLPHKMELRMAAASKSSGFEPSFVKLATLDNESVVEGLLAKRRMNRLHVLG